MLYLDNAATTPMSEYARARFKEYLDLEIGNASALHRYGTLARQEIEKTRAIIARSINALPEEIIFTAGGTESNNTVMNIFRGQKVLVSNVEHPSVLEPAKMYCDLEIIAVNKNGSIDTLQNFTGKKFGLKEVDLVSIMLANNEVGAINDIVKLREELKFKNPEAFFHTDATQAFGKIEIDVKKMGVDYMTLSGHKVGAPIGVGILYVRKRARFKSLMLGGHQERGRRAGTQNTLAILGLLATLEEMSIEERVLKYTKLRGLRDKLAEEILAKVPFASLNHRLSNSLPHILNVSFEAAEGESIQLYLDLIGDIIVSTGSACASGDGSPSHVLMALFNDAEVAHSSTRFSLGLDFKEEDIERVVEVLKGVVDRLQKISTVKIKQRKI